MAITGVFLNAPRYTSETCFDLQIQSYYEAASDSVRQGKKTDDQKVKIRGAIQKAQGIQDISIGSAYNILGVIYLNEKDYEGAKSYLENAVKSLRKNLEEAGLRYAVASLNLGNSYFELKQYDQAETHYRQALYYYSDLYPQISGDKIRRGEENVIQGKLNAIERRRSEAE